MIVAHSTLYCLNQSAKLIGRIINISKTVLRYRYTTRVPLSCTNDGKSILLEKPLGNQWLKSYERHKGIYP